MDDFLTKYLDGPIKEVCFDWIYGPWYVPFIVDGSHSHLSCRKRLKLNQAKKFKNEEQTMVIRTVFTVYTSDNTVNRIALNWTRITMVIGANWDDLYFDYLEYVADKPVVYGKNIYWDEKIRNKMSFIWEFVHDTNGPFWCIVYKQAI